MLSKEPINIAYQQVDDFKEAEERFDRAFGILFEQVIENRQIMNNERKFFETGNKQA